MGAGIPVVADDVGVTGTVLGGTEAGSVVSSSVEWEAALFELLSDVSVRRDKGARARARAEAHYSVARWGPEVAGIIKDCS